MELERLIATEQANDERVRRAAEEASAIVRAARELAQQREASLAEEIERLTITNAAALATERDGRIAEIVASAGTAIKRYDAVTDAQLATVARVLIQDLVTESVVP